MAQNLPFIFICYIHQSIALSRREKNVSEEENIRPGLKTNLRDEGALDLAACATQGSGALFLCCSLDITRSKGVTKRGEIIRADHSLKYLLDLT